MRRDEELGNPERILATYATAYDAYSEIANFKSRSEIRGLRYVGKSHVACLRIMFLDGRLAMPTIDVRM